MWLQSRSLQRAKSLTQQEEIICTSISNYIHIEYEGSEMVQNIQGETVFSVWEKWVKATAAGCGDCDRVYLAAFEVSTDS